MFRRWSVVHPVDPVMWEEETVTTTVTVLETWSVETIIVKSFMPMLAPLQIVV